MSARLIRRGSVVAVLALTTGLSLVVLGPTDSVAPAAVTSSSPFRTALPR